MDPLDKTLEAIRALLLEHTSELSERIDALEQRLNHNPPTERSARCHTSYQ